jgi:hypothetical protein
VIAQERRWHMDDERHGALGRRAEWLAPRRQCLALACVLRFVWLGTGWTPVCRVGRCVSRVPRTSCCLLSTRCGIHTPAQLANSDTVFDMLHGPREGCDDL